MYVQVCVSVCMDICLCACICVSGCGAVYKYMLIVCECVYLWTYKCVSLQFVPFPFLPYCLKVFDATSRMLDHITCKFSVIGVIYMTTDF